MGGKLKTNLPVSKKSHMTEIPDSEDIKRKELKYGVNQKKYCDKNHRVKDLEEFEPGRVFWIAVQISYGRIKTKHAIPRSYLVETPVGID
ncbi:hypothetical protein AVEN_273499-1 [Araneus ventricosus]|uniref:Uncharacterized protein n=1 Tax=Araneus ventricosus TaxID=182803 RepID=A0A4Y2H3G6_ARAVE|nr:hypothetical protein AVEN_273499-1 [Araneus ventricosus]